MMTIFLYNMLQAATSCMEDGPCNRVRLVNFILCSQAAYCEIDIDNIMCQCTAVLDF